MHGAASPRHRPPLKGRGRAALLTRPQGTDPIWPAILAPQDHPAAPTQTLPGRDYGGGGTLNAIKPWTKGYVQCLKD